MTKLGKAMTPPVQKTRVPAVEGLFTMDEENPRLIGGKGTGRESYFFPKDLAGADPAGTTARMREAVSPTAGRSSTPNSEQATQQVVRQEVLLSSTGTVWSYTTASYPPPAPYVVTRDPWEPFVLAAVELPEKIVVLGPMSEDVSLEDMHIGMKVHLGLTTLYEDDEHEYISWEWRPSNA